MKTMLRVVKDRGHCYDALLFLCPGCKAFSQQSTGLNLLPVNTSKLIFMVPVDVSKMKRAVWEWDGDLEAPTLSPSILSKIGGEVCHSFLKDGVFEFLPDCTHEFSGQNVPLPDLPDWFLGAA